MSEHSETRETRETNKNDIYLSIYTSIREKISHISLLKNQNLHKVHIGLSVDESLHDAAKFIASYLKTDISELYAQGLLKVLAEKVEQLPNNIELNVTHTLPKPLANPMVDVELDLIKRELSSYYEDYQRVKDDYSDQYVRRNFLYGKLERTLPKAMRLARHSDDPELRSLIIDVAAVLRKSPKTKKIIQLSPSELERRHRGLKPENNEISCSSVAEAQALVEKLNRENPR